MHSADRDQLRQRYKEAGSSSASQIVTEVDLESEALIRQSLEAASEQWDIAFVGEESSQTVADLTPARLLKPYYWCVDPLDGTLPFVQGKPGYAVSIALVAQSGEPLIGVVYDPVHSKLLHAIKGQGAYEDRARISGAEFSSTSLKVFADESFRVDKRYAEVSGALNDCATNLGLGGIEMIYGSGAVKNACQVLDYPAACYLKTPKTQDGGGSIWDFAATACIVREAGGWASDALGQTLVLNPPGSTFMNQGGVLYASNERIARYLIDRL
ncbi:inositol monophosphatase family protein [Congregibacter variabilis]|uniref:Inositol monophosphatase family protein n=1 Tax=Congregibacter variabilis TaxID=3081200 RepID=A0ABZ0I5T2_9GAMM|nr:inositol monophosphatase family protein [Congregibacter sp. IMCC43200]